MAPGFSLVDSGTTSSRKCSREYTGKRPQHETRPNSHGGFGDPLVAMLTTPERSRKWAPWNIPANLCGLFERPNGVAQIFFGSNNSSGKIYALTLGTYSDDGIAINSYYSTAFLAATGLGGRNPFGYLTAYVQGSGSLAISALTPGDVSSLPLGS
jgi:hypothetical protein